MENLGMYALIAVGVFLVYRMVKKNTGANRISQEKAKEMMSGDVTILDVRESGEYAGGHIKNAKSAPLSNLELNVAKIVKEKDETLLIYCLSGARSATATKKLVTLGYSNVHNFGGIMSWKY